MILLGDYHTHTVFSHGKGTIEENVKVAQKKGLKEIAIADHGFQHRLYNIKRRDVPLMRKQIEDLKQTWKTAPTPKKKDKISKHIKELQKQLEKLSKNADE